MPVQRAVSHLLWDDHQARTCFGQLGCMTMPQCMDASLFAEIDLGGDLLNRRRPAERLLNGNTRLIGAESGGIVGWFTSVVMRMLRFASVR
jgi:hypothetical protein